jgi:hypothetical protein
MTLNFRYDFQSASGMVVRASPRAMKKLGSAMTKSPVCTSAASRRVFQSRPGVQLVASATVNLL